MTATPVDLAATARALVTPGKGILASDESDGTIAKRFASVGLASTPENRMRYRRMLYGTPGLGRFISGVILFDETLRQADSAGRPLVDLVLDAGIIPGIKVDRGTAPLPGFPGETVTEGLDGLRHRLEEYRELGARFTKWRAVLSVGAGRPSPTCVAANAEVLGRFAALSQEAGLVPVVEPDVVMDGDHPMAAHADATACAVAATVDALRRHRVALDGVLLKTNMVLPGRDSGRSADPRTVAEETLRCLRDTLPPAVPGVVFLSGGQPAQQATANLDALNRLGGAPWELAFSFSRALQEPVLPLWAQDQSREDSAQEALLHRAACNAAARRGAWSTDMEPR